jgi:hypothetical protein
MFMLVISTLAPLPKHQNKTREAVAELLAEWLSLICTNPGPRWIWILWTPKGGWKAAIGNLLFILKNHHIQWWFRKYPMVTTCNWDIV